MKFKISSIHFTSIFPIFFVFVFQFHFSINRMQNLYESTFNRTTSFIMLNSLHALSHRSFSEENDPLQNQILKYLKISPLLKTTRLNFLPTPYLCNITKLWRHVYGEPNKFKRGLIPREGRGKLIANNDIVLIPRVEITFAFCGWRRRWHNSNFLPTSSFVPFDFYFL